MVAKKKVLQDYTPIGGEISTASTYVQAALALDIAATFAIETKDAEQLTQVAMVWLEMGTRLAAPDEEEEYDGDVAGTDDDYPRGFVSPSVDAAMKEKRKSSGDTSDS